MFLKRPQDHMLKHNVRSGKMSGSMLSLPKEKKISTSKLNTGSSRQTGWLNEGQIYRIQSLLFSRLNLWNINCRPFSPRLSWGTYHETIIDQFHKSRRAPVSYPAMPHSELKCAHYCSEWSIDVLWVMEQMPQCFL